MKTKKAKITCNAGFSKVMEIPANNVFDKINEFVAYSNKNPESAFLPECDNCNNPKICLSFGNETDTVYIVKVCNFTLKDE